MIKLGPTGQISRGHVLDVNPRFLERRLKDYDSQLYLKWSPQKFGGWGAWEVRRRPEKNYVKNIVVYAGNTYIELAPVELDVVSNVLTAPYVDYRILTRIQEMDAWKSKTWVKDLEQSEKEHTDKIKAEQRELLKLQAKDNRRAIQDLRNALLSGTNPHLLGKFWGRS